LGTTLTPALLALEDGSLFRGTSIGIEGQSVGEVVFNTAMTGYQEILTDPSYARQIITLTYPQIGNTGANPEDVESDQVWASGLVIRQLPRLASSWRMTMTLPEYLAAENVVAIADVDTRRLTRLIREKGALAGCIIGGDATEAEAVLAAQAFPGLAGMDLAQVVTRADQADWTESVWDLARGYGQRVDERFHVVAYDFGVKRNILRLLAARGCRITVVPAQTSAEDALALKPDGIFLSNGPGDPEPCSYAIEAIGTLLDKDLPIFGICLGHQLLALASGASTVKMPHGHHGANHPVKDLRSEQVIITSQNHGFAVDAEALPDCLETTHVSLFDGTLQGVRRTDRPAFGFQGHPEASPGPQDCEYLFDQFVELMEGSS
jgi:carbamoyl-phosphate synthase small subunit